ALRTEPRLMQVLIRRLLCVFMGGILANVPEAALTAEPTKPDQALEARIQAVIPDVERYISSGMKAFDVPGLGIGIIANDKLVYGKGFGVPVTQAAAQSGRRQCSRSAQPPKVFSLRLSL